MTQKLTTGWPDMAGESALLFYNQLDEPVFSEVHETVLVDSQEGYGFRSHMGEAETYIGRTQPMPATFAANGAACQ